MQIKVGKYLIKTSSKIDKLPKEFVDFAIENRSTNGNYYWTPINSISPMFRLENIQLIDRQWSWIDKIRALSLRFSFTKPQRHLISGNLANEEKDAQCYEHGILDYGGYFVNLAESNDVDIYKALIDLDLKYAFPFDIRNFIERW